ncbi:SWIM zinc finger family protein [Streptomyces sp. NPDC046862]|uniref:SWIM zinc finger family protein n=1 Tax=Streptomyces sp. NPDC046862 TaxID=3154603 RepID=UPI0034540E11
MNGDEELRAGPGPDAPAPRDSQAPGPADAARRALRAARERDARDRDERPAEPPAEQEARPGDVAREALRRAVRGERGRKGGEDPGERRAEDAPAEPDTAEPDATGPTGAEPAPAVPGTAAPGTAAPGTAAPDTAAPGTAAPGTAAPGTAKSGTAPSAPSARPGDIAREALRAARQVRAAAQEEQARPSRRATRPASPRSGGARRNAVSEERGGRVRQLRELLADAFEPPTAGDADEAAHRHHDTPPHHDAPPPHHDAPPTHDTTPPTHHNAPSRSHTPAPAAPPPAPAPHSAPHLPRSMAAPARDSELRRTFSAFPPRSAPPEEAGRFAGTWWGNAWVTALEEGALDAARLARGRTYAQSGHVDAITVTPGLVLGYVQGSRPRPYRAQVRLRTLSEADWDRFLDAVAERPGHIAALLDKEMPHSLAECGVPLLPGPGDLEPHCSCPDSGHPCKHAAALCYQTARLLDEDPFVLLLLRGRGERELLDALSRLSAARAARAAQDQEAAPLPGVRAGDALTPRTLPPLPAPLPPPPHPEQPPVYPGGPGGPDPFALDQLATDAAARAHALLTTGRDPVADLTLWQDAVRLAVARPGSGLTAGTRALYSSLATATGRTPADLARAVAAWRQGGPEGLAVLEEPWDPPAGRFDRARPLLLAADLPAFRPRRNHLTHPHGHVQLRLGRDGLWYAYESEPGREDWWPRGTPDLDPVGALTGLGAADEV